MNDLNFRLAVEELAFIAVDSDIKVLFVDDMFLEAPLGSNQHLSAPVYMADSRPVGRRPLIGFWAIPGRSPQTIVIGGHASLSVRFPPFQRSAANLENRQLRVVS